MSYIPDPLTGWIPTDPAGRCLPGRPETPSMPMAKPEQFERIIGTCSKCRGAVVERLSICPVAYCKRCGAKKKPEFGPIIEME